MGTSGCFMAWSFASIVASIIMKSEILVQGQQQVRCLFFMGDSLLDNGNNNYLETVAKSNYPPYGIDYPNGPTGRFSNGQNIADFLAKILGFDKPIPPFVSTNDSEILKGVNYASGSAGILNETGQTHGDRFSLDRQLQNHQTIISHLSLLLGSKERANEHLRTCLYTVYIGSNDYLNNYFLPQLYPSSKLYTLQQFAQILIEQYSRQLKTLYNCEARKVAVFGVGLIGCIPSSLQIYPSTNGSPCADFMNEAAHLFNNKLKSLIDTLNNDLPDAQFIFVNTTSISSVDPSSLGIKVLNAPCCQVSRTIAPGQCAVRTVPCYNRSEYIFYDNFHPMEIINWLTAARAYNATLPTDAYPFDIRRLVQQQ